MNIINSYEGVEGNKIIVNGTTLIDLTADTVSSDKVLNGFTFHDKSGEIQEGNCSFDSDTSSDTAAVAQILLNKTAHARGALLTGTMPNNGSITGSISAIGEEYTIPQGYHDGSGKVSISSIEQAKIIADNIRSGEQTAGWLPHLGRWPSPYQWRRRQLRSDYSTRIVSRRC